MRDCGQEGDDRAGEKRSAENQRDDAGWHRLAHLMWWSVLRGLAVAALLSQADAVLDALGTPRWYLALYFVATAMDIGTSWVMVAWHALLLRWPLSIPTEMLEFASNLALCLAALNVTRPPRWMGAMTLSVAALLLLRRRLLRAGAWATFSPAMLARVAEGQRIYVVVLVLSALGAMHLASRPAWDWQVRWGIVVLAGALTTLWWQHKDTERQRREL